MAYNFTKKTYIRRNEGKILELLKLNINEEQIVEYFKDNGCEYFDCGVGYYQEEAIIHIKTKNSKIFEVQINAECVGQSNDYGDKTYFVDEITSVKYNEISELQYIKLNIKSLEYQQTSLVNELTTVQLELSELYYKEMLFNEN